MEQPIDGTVAGDDISQIDSDISHDHSYYGNGCSIVGGSTVACSYTLVQTFDGENQKIGVYHNYQSATSGSGGTISTDNANSPDSFCPLGWQLPYSGTGGDYYDDSKSWIKLFTDYNIKYAGGKSDDDGTIIKSYPFSYVYPGNYRWHIGKLYDASANGSYWSSTVKNSNSSYRIDTWATSIWPAHTLEKTYGLPIRCVLILATFHRRHGGRYGYLISRQNPELFSNLLRKWLRW